MGPCRVPEGSSVAVLAGLNSNSRERRGLRRDFLSTVQLVPVGRILPVCVAIFVLTVDTDGKGEVFNVDT